MKVLISQPAKTATQSGKKQSFWILTPILDEKYRTISDLSGWTSSSDTKSQLKLKFQNAQDAQTYAKSQGWEFETKTPKEPQIIKKSYADNFLQK